MDNKQVAEVFYEMADLLLIQGGNPHRIRAFRRTARVLENLPEPVALMLRLGTLSKVPGIGEGSVHRIKQILRTGTCDDHRELRRNLPPGLRDMLEVKGLGARTVRIIWSHLKVGSIPELEHAIRTGRLQTLPRIGQRTAERILKGIEAWKQRIGRVPLVTARRTGMQVVDALRTLPAVHRITLGGSVRRGKATIGDLDVLVAADDAGAVAARFVTLPFVDEVLLRGEGRCSVRLHNRQQVDLRVLPIENWGAGLHYFTGSQLHNIAIRARGLKVAGLKISDKGIFLRDTDVRVHSGPREEDIFAAVGLPWIPPELRENTGEIEAAAAGRLPRLVEEPDLQGDLHMHTLASDGTGTARQMAEAALALGHRYIAITDHTKSLEVAHGLDEGRLIAQMRHLRQLEDDLGALRIATGTEVDILADGSLDLDLDVLRQLDWVVASVHSRFDMTGQEMTDRLIRAMETGVVDCIGHPSGRRLGQRNGAELDMERLLQAARKLGVALEVNGNPHRMDLSDVHCRQAREMGVPVVINTDSHAPDHLRHREFGLLTARRGWIEPKHVLNCQPWATLADRRRDRLRTRGWVVPDSLPAPARKAPVNEPVTLYPTAPVDSGHWPEDDAPASAPPTTPPPPAPPAVPLSEALQQRPLAPELRARLDDWLRNGGDDELEAALAELGPNPMQVGFNLIFGA